MIEIENVYVKFGKREIISNFSLKTKKNEMIAITGESGKGKSTLLNIIGLLNSDYKGNLKIMGKLNPKFDSKEGRELLKYHIGYIFQSYALVDNKDVEYNLNLVRNDKSELTNDEALKYVGLEGFRNKKIVNLSGGEQQRIAIARILIKNPDIILADEPTGSLDSKNRDIILELLKKMKNKGKLVIIVTHDEYIKKICDRSIQL